MAYRPVKGLRPKSDAKTRLALPLATESAAAVSIARRSVTVTSPFDPRDTCGVASV